MRKLICLFLALTLVFTLCACGKEDAVNESESKSNDATGNVVSEDIVYQVGDYITFGSYEQDNNLDNGKEEIEWLILDVQDGKVLVISKYGLDAQPYNKYHVDVTWEDCTLRQWLNDYFLNSAFSESEQKKIQTTTVVAENEEHDDTEAGNDTQDKIFLLSVKEVYEYFDSGEERESTPTDYAVAEGCWTDTMDDYYGNCWWWLRSPGDYQYWAAGVTSEGNVDVNGFRVDLDNRAVRPVMWIECGKDDIVDNGDATPDVQNTTDMDSSDDNDIGSYITFGSYEQDGDTSNGKEDIEWLILDIQDGKALVISKYALDCKPYNTEFADVTWETCTLRQWLNDDFINAAFSADEKAMIPTVTVSADENPGYTTNPGDDTQDKIFLLSINEAEEYFDSSDARECSPTDYAVAYGAYVSSGNCCWWLRSPGGLQSGAARVNFDGDVGVSGDYVNDDTPVVRPAMWIEIG